MRLKNNHIVIILGIILLSGCAKGIRLQHPKPSLELVKSALLEAQQVRDVKGNPVDNKNIASFDKLITADSKVEEFFLASVDSDLTLHTKGFTRNEYIFGLDFPEGFARAGIPNKPIRAILYQYSGKLKGALFAVPHMTDSANSRESMVLFTDPITPFYVDVFYTDGSSAKYNLKSSNSYAVLGGGFRRKQTNKFDGKLWLELDNSRHYYVGTPYNN